MAKPKTGEFGPRVRKVVDLVTKDALASDTAEKVRAAIVEHEKATEEKNEAMAEFKGVEDSWEGKLGLNKAAMKSLLKIKAMDEKKRADFLRTFLPGLETLLPDQMDMFTGNPEDSKTKSEAEQPPPAAPSLQ